MTSLLAKLPLNLRPDLSELLQGMVYSFVIEMVPADSL